MSPWRSKAVTAARMTGRRLTTSIHPRDVFLAAPDGCSPNDAVAAFEAWCAQNAGTDCRLLLSSAWVRTCVLPPEARSLSQAELHAYALRQFQHYFPATEAAGPARWALSVSRARQAPVACGAPREWIEQIAAAAGAHRVRLRSVLPWWAPATSYLLRQAAELVAVEPGMTTHFQAQQGCLSRLWSTFGPASISEGALVLRLEVSGVVGVVCDHIALSTAHGGVAGRNSDVNWSSDLDLLGPRVHASALSWLLLLGSAAAVVAMALKHDDALLEQSLARHRLESAVHRAAHAPRLATAASQPTQADLSGALALTDRLAHPWAPILQEVESAADSVSILELRHSADDPAVYLEIQAPDDASAWRFVRRLNASGTFQRVNVQSREPASKSAGEGAVRLRVAAIRSSGPAGGRP